MKISFLDTERLKAARGKPVRFLNHNQAPVTGTAKHLHALATEYFHKVAPVYGIDPADLARMNEKPETEPVNEKNGFRLEGEKHNQGTAVVSYVQTYFGLPVYQAGIKAAMQEEPLRITSSASTVKFDVKVQKPSEKSIREAKKYGQQQLLAALGMRDVKKTNILKINRTRLVVYRLDAEHRTHHDHDVVKAPQVKSRSKQPEAFPHAAPALKLPALDKRLQDGNYYVALEVLFTFQVPGFKTLNWIAFIEVETNSVLYYRALVDNATGYVFKRDPFDSTGNAANDNTASNATLNPLRDLGTLEGLDAPAGGTTQELSGEYVVITDDEIPNIAVPTEASPYVFDYDVRTNDFAAVNAYYHCDGFFRMMADMGFDVADYFDGTTFPVHVDHRGRFGTADGIEINASCGGNAMNNGIGLIDFELATLDDEAANPVGMALVSRVVLHEIGGHGILWDHVESPNFGFAHSAGDSVGVILNDPGSQWADRFDSFPWVIIDIRRHDRDVAVGWGWGGAMDTGGYNSEQILSTTLFRFYLSIGGDHPDLSRKEFAARFAVYLILKAVGTLTPATNPADAEGFEIALEDADAADWTSADPAVTYAGGAYHKVIRWAFEKQDMFGGNAPAVDVYINDGRNGEYQFLYNHWSCTDIWNRTSIGDGGGVHIEPIVDEINYAYVRIWNRGSVTAQNIVVKGFHCLPGAGLTYPDDWTAMATASLPAPDLDPGMSVIVGPFEWTPSQEGHECMFMSVSADDGTGTILDESNIDGRVTGPIPEWRLVPHDNNIGQRNVAPVAGGFGATGLIASLENRPFWVGNSFDLDNVKFEIKATLPKFLQEKKWAISFRNPGGNRFTLHKGMKKEVNIHLTPGADFTKEEVLKNMHDNRIDVMVYGNGGLIGGMTYYLDPELERTRYTYTGGGNTPGKGGCMEKASKAVLDCLNIKGDHIKCVKLNKISVDIHFKNGDCDC